MREEETAALVRALAAGVGEKELGRELNFCAVNALSRAVMGRRVFGRGLGKEAEEFKRMVVELMQLAGVFNVGDFVPWLKKVDPQGVVKRMKSLHRRYDEMLNRMISSQELTAGKGKDLLSCMMAMRGQPIDDQGGSISDTDIKALLLVFVLSLYRSISLPRSNKPSTCRICLLRGRTRRRARWNGRWRR